MNENKALPFFVTSSHWLYKHLLCRTISIFHWHHEWRIQPFLLRGHICPTKCSHGILEKLHTNSRYTRMALKLLQNSKISSIIVLLADIIFLSTIKTSYVSVTVTCSLIRVLILRRVSINIIYHMHLKLIDIAEYKLGA